MKTPRSTQQLPDFDPELDHDSVWDLLDQAPSQSPSPRFAPDLVRKARLEGQETPSWWKSLLSPKPMIGIATAACACLALVMSLPSEPNTPAPAVVTVPEEIDNWEEQFDDVLANALLTSVAEDPSLLSDAELVALLY